MKSSLKEYEVDGQYFCETNGMKYDTAGEFIQNGLFGYCNCGAPEDHLEYVRQGLMLIKETSDLYRSGKPVHSDVSKALRDKIQAHYGSAGAEYAQYYWFDYIGLTEHGGSVPGWLSPEGENMLNILNEWAEQHKAKEGAAG